MSAVTSVSRDQRQSANAPWYRRGITVVVVAVIVAVCFWAGGFSPEQWISKLVNHTTPHKEPAAVSIPQAVPAPAIPTPPMGNDTSVSKVPLPLLLVGTMPGRNSHEGLAFIGVDKNSPQTYQAGALLVNNARIAEIYTDHIVLERDRQRVELYLEGRGNHKVDPRLAGLLTVGGTEPPPPAKITSHEVLTDYLRPSPVYDGEVLRGYQVYPGQQAGVFAQLGLEPGDIITSLNGVPLNEPQTAVNQLRQLTEGISATATIERAGKHQTISLDGALITQHQQAPQNESPQPASM